MALERVVGLKFPVWHKKHLELSPKALTWVKFGVPVTAYTLTIHAVFTYSIHNEANSCCFDAGPLINRIFLQFATAVSATIPLIILLCSNTVFAKTLLERRRHRIQAPSNPIGPPQIANTPQTATRQAISGETNSTRAKEREEIEKNYIAMLFWNTTSFLMFNFSAALLHTLGSNLDEENGARLLRNSSTIPVVMIVSTSFFFYYMSGPMFQKAFKTFITSLFSIQAEVTQSVSRVTAEQPL